MSIADGFKIKSVGIANLTEDFPDADAWDVTVTNPRGQTLTQKYYKGSAHKGAAPEVMEFMNALVSDADCVAHRDSVEEFAADLGYEIDTPEELWHVTKIYKACQKTAQRLETFLTWQERTVFENY